MSRKRKNFEALADKLRREISGAVEEKVLMKRYTTFRIGGICELMVFPNNRKELAFVIEECENQGFPWRILGRGSNLLVKDGGLEEVVINLQKGFNQIEQIDDERVKADAGVRLSHLVKFCQELGLSGLEFCVGIPGTVGGAIRMNAGAEGDEIFQHLLQVEFYRPPEGNYFKKSKELNFNYRHLQLKPKEVILSAEFQLSPDNPREIRERIVNYLKKRRRSQPVAYPSAGSIFKNPPGDYAGRIIEELGLKGFRVGDAQVSELHANFIVNRGRAKASQVLELIRLIQEKARKEKGIQLELEIEVVGKER